MTPELGQFSLILALLLALAQATIPLAGAATGRESWMRMARSATIGQFVFVTLAFLLLTYAFIAQDFSVMYVARNSNLQLPLIYRISAVWGAHEGSFLLWAFILNIWSMMIAVRGRNLPLPFHARVLAIMGWISLGFLVFMLFTSNPFERLLPAVADARISTRCCRIQV